MSKCYATKWVKKNAYCLCSWLHDFHCLIQRKLRQMHKNKWVVRECLAMNLFYFFPKLNFENTFDHKISKRSRIQKSTSTWIIRNLKNLKDTKKLFSLQMNHRNSKTIQLVFITKHNLIFKYYFSQLSLDTCVPC